MQRLPLLLPIDSKQPLTFVLLAALCSCLLMVISTLTFLYIEKPGMATGKKAANWLRQKMQARVQAL